MTSNTGSGGGTQDSIVLASFDSYRHAEHMLASLGRQLRSDARKGNAAAVIIRGNPDGSLKLTQSRVLTAEGFGYAVIKVSMGWIVGFLGTFSMLKGARGGIHAAQMHKGHIGSDEHAAHQLLADAGPNAALLLVRCTGEQTKHTVAAGTAASAMRSWDGSLADSLAALDPGTSHDWVREAVHQTSHTAHHRPTHKPHQ